MAMYAKYDAVAIALTATNNRKNLLGPKCLTKIGSSTPAVQR